MRNIWELTSLTHSISLSVSLDLTPKAFPLGTMTEKPPLFYEEEENDAAMPAAVTFIIRHPCIEYTIQLIHQFMNFLSNYTMHTACRVHGYKVRTQNVAQEME